MRLGDYRSLPHYGFTLYTPPSWWYHWLRGIWESFEKPMLFICSDSLDDCLPQFATFQPVTIRDLNLSWGSARSDILDYVDFYLLTQADVLGISNSTFGFVAAMLNRRARLFVRPHWDFQSRFSVFDPWDSEPLLYYGGRQCMFKPLTGALSAAYTTGGIKSLLRCSVLYPWKRAILEAQAIATRVKCLHSAR